MISPFRLARLAVRVGEWAAPHITKWHTERHMNRSLGESNLAARNYSEAEKYLTLAVDEELSRMGTDKSKYALILKLAEAQRMQHKYSEAQETLSHVMESLSSAGKQASEEYARCLDMIASMREETGDLAEAHRMYLESLAVEQKLSTPDPQRTANATMKAARVAAKMGDAGAETALWKALSMMEQGFGPEAPETGGVLCELGLFLQNQHRHTDAVPLFERALRIYRGSETTSGDASKTLQYLAVSYQETGNLDAAAEQYESALRLKEREVGVSPADLAHMEVNLAKIYIQWSRMGRARELLMHATSVLDRQPGPMRDDALQTLAELYDRSGNVADAAATRRKAMGQAAR